MPKPKIEHISYDDTEECDRCGKPLSADFGTERLCKQCVCDDVFESMSEIND